MCESKDGKSYMYFKNGDEYYVCIAAQRKQVGDGHHIYTAVKRTYYVL
jgi:hypothetical protein